MSEYVQIAPDGQVQSTREPFRFIVDGKKFELPALDSNDVPLPLIPAFLMLSASEQPTEEQKMHIAAAFISYLEQDHPKLWATLKRQTNALAWVNGLIRQWGDHSGLDPKQPASGD